MKPPIEPKEEDCCKSDCNPCIFHVYEKRLRAYEKFKKTNSQDFDKCNLNGILEMEYTTFIVSAIAHVSDTIKILKFKKLSTNKGKVCWNPGDHFLIKYSKDESYTCSRAYTPIKLKTDDIEDYDFLIVLKKYSNGLVSKYLFNLIVGDETLWRGPYGDYKIEPNKYNRLIMIAQGTGIAPFLSIIDEILNDEDDMTRIILYFCCKNIDEVLFRNVLYEYGSYWNFSYKIFLSDENNDNLKPKYQEPLVNKKFDINELDNLKPFSGDQIILCGSQMFMESYKNILLNEPINVVLF